MKRLGFLLVFFPVVALAQNEAGVAAGGYTGWLGKLLGLGEDPSQQVERSTLQRERALNESASREGSRRTYSSRIIGEGAQRAGRIDEAIDGIEVIGGGLTELSFQGDDDRVVTHSISGEISTVPAFDVETSRALLRSHGVPIAETDRSDLKVLMDRAQGRPRLVRWFVRAQDRADVILDAHSGEPIAEIPAEITFGSSRPKPSPTPTPVPSVKPIPSTVAIYSAATTQAAGDWSSSGSPMVVDLTHYLRFDGSSILKDQSGSRALANSLRVLDYYSNAHGRRSFDGAGSVLKSVAHMGRAYANAFWDRRNQLMAYGDGDGVVLGDLTRGVDIAGHEMTHGVISTTANLIYAAESGALNEAIADFFGVMIEGKQKWQLGTDAILDPALKQTGIRDLASPGRVQGPDGVPYPSRMSEKRDDSGFCSAFNDQCWVHVNSTIIGHALYLAVQRSSASEVERVVYRALLRLAETSRFAEFASAARAEAGTESAAVSGAIDSALRDVGL